MIKTMAGKGEVVSKHGRMCFAIVCLLLLQFMLHFKCRLFHLSRNKGSCFYTLLVFHLQPDDNQLATVFMKVDADCDGTVDWV